MNIKSIEAMLKPQANTASVGSEGAAAILISLGHCEHVCLLCADACSRDATMARLDACIRVNLDCAEICSVTAAVLVRHTDASGAVVHAQLQSCAMVCKICADLCATHASQSEPCRLCAEVCRDCREKCNLALGESSAGGLIGNN